MYLPLTNVPIPTNASKFTGFVSGVVTFDIPNVHMETVFGDVVKCPEEDSILTDIVEEQELSDLTTIGGVQWSDLKLRYFYEANFDRKALYNSLNDTEQYTLIREFLAQILTFLSPLQFGQGNLRIKSSLVV